jgi:hypothetical protein
LSIEEEGLEQDERRRAQDGKGQESTTVLGMFNRGLTRKNTKTA